MIAWAVVAAYNPGLVVLRIPVLHTVLARTAKEVVVPIVVAHKVVEVVHKAVEVAAPIVVVHKVVEVAHWAAVVVDSNLAAAVGLDHKT